MKLNSAKAWLLLGVACSGLAVSLPARAEAGAEEDKGNDIVVTAQRREERLIDVPIAITALNSESLDKAGVANLQDLERVTPGLAMPLYGGFLRPSIRGISSGLSTLNDSSNVAVYIDGVYQPVQNGAIVDMPGVQSVQILKGPQGTLYGQNATGGAIIIDTVNPKFDLTGQLIGTVGNYNDLEFRGFVTGPLSDKVAVLISGGVADRDGFNRDLVHGGRDKGLRSVQLRGKVLLELDDQTSFTLGGFYSDRKDSGVYVGAPLNGNSLGNSLVQLYKSYGLMAPGTPIATQPHTYATTFQPDLQTKSWGVNLLGKIGIGDIGTLNTVTAYQKYKSVDVVDVDLSPLYLGEVNPLVVKGDWYIQELNFVSEHLGRFYFTAGGFYMHRQEEFWPSEFGGFFSGPGAQISGVQDFTAGDFILNAYARSKKNSYAGYLELNYDLTDQLTVTLAGRYSYETVNVSANSMADQAMNLANLIPDPRGSHNFKKFTPRAVLRYKINDDHTVYASYSKGFKSGFVDFQGFGSCPGGPQDGSCLPDPVQPETVDAFEIGYKGRIAGVLDVSLAAFHYSYKNIQVFIYSAPVGFYQNAAAGRLNGFDFDLSWAATSELRLAVGGSYVDSKYTKFPAAYVYVQTPAAGCALAGGLPFPCGNFQTPIDVSGNQLQNAPKFTGTASIDYHHDFTQGRLGINVNGNYNSGFPFDVNGHIQQKKYALLNAEVSFEPTDLQGLRLVIWGKNLTNHDYIQGSLPTFAADSVSWAPPRTWGGRLEFRF